MVRIYRCRVMTVNKFNADCFRFLAFGSLLMKNYRGQDVLSPSGAIIKSLRKLIICYPSVELSESMCDLF